ncbi:MAG TPA: PcfJ domain-containing protein [Gemmataceae bacterium]|nr:PcfJ domain-containing protein [Gemmataceae bacterium]
MFNVGLLNLALHHADWLRPVEHWAAPRMNSLPQFASLAHHLLAKYPVPAFMTSVWFIAPSQPASRQQGWFKHIGLGFSIRHADLPLPLTRAMAHWFAQAPDHYTVEMALRWAQVRGLGGHEMLAKVVATTRLGTVFKNEDFWLTALRFFVNHPKIDLAQIGPIVDFLQHQRFEPQEVCVHGVFVKQPPPQPDYAMKGRSLRSVMRQVAEWHKQLGKETKKPVLRWPRCKIGEFEHIEGNEHLASMRRWTITELLTSRRLFDEGRLMHHCVGTYAEPCAKRQTSIWSLTVENDQGCKPVLTVEVDLTRRTICQIRGRCNRLPKDHEREIIRRWAMWEGLRIAEQI